MEPDSPRAQGETILVLAPTGRDAPHAVSVLEQAKLHASICPNLACLARCVGSETGAVILAEESLASPDIKILVERLACQDAWSDVPIIVITGGGATTKVTLWTLDLLGPAGNVTLLERPLRSVTLISAVQVALRARRRQYQVRDLLERLDSYAEELEEKVDERTAQLRETIQFLESFCYSIAHDLRAPLRTIQGLTTIILEDYATAFDDEGKDYANRVAGAAERMDFMILDLLAYGRLSQEELTCSAVDTEAQIDSVLQYLDGEISERNGEVEVIRPFSEVWAHQSALSQALTNILSNALKFVNPGEAPRIRIYQEETGEGTIRICVRDNGIGIPNQYFGKIFGVFQRLHGVGDFPGNGIGLALARKGVERMGGTVGVDSTPGEGSCFWIELASPPGLAATNGEPVRTKPIRSGIPGTFA